MNSKRELNVDSWFILLIRVGRAVSGRVRGFIYRLTNSFGSSSVVDHVLEFRDYGAYITSTSRNIKLENIFKIPFYPVIPEVTESEFPRVLNKSKINIFTGGDLSKIAIKNDYFLNLLVDIVSRYESVNIVIAGGGDSSKLMNFIQSNKVSDKIHYIGFRQDLPEIMSNIDIYLSTYPLGGGLMNAYALHFKRPIISFVDIELTHTFIENSFDIPEKISYSSKEGFFDELDKLVLNKKYREDKGLRFCGYLTSRESFRLRLNNYLNGRLESLTAPKPFNTSLERSKKNVIDAENAGLGSFSKIFFKELGAYSVFFPKIAINSLFKILKWKSFKIYITSIK